VPTNKVMRELKRILKEENDSFRTTFFTSPFHKVVMTASLVDDPNREDVITAVREFKNFNDDNDPHGEHDCAIFEVKGTKYMFKIDYYDEGFHVGMDPYEGKVARLLTILRADEY
jgi:hypothetical protein